LWAGNVAAKRRSEDEVCLGLSSSGKSGKSHSEKAEWLHGVELDCTVLKMGR
jgi:hypothetical protein